MDVMLGIVFGSSWAGDHWQFSLQCRPLVAGLTLVITHWVFSRPCGALALVRVVYSRDTSGCSLVGKLQLAAMRKLRITGDDLRDALRSRGRSPDFAEVPSAHLERNGNISIIKRQNRARLRTLGVDRRWQHSSAVAPKLTTPEIRKIHVAGRASSGEGSPPYRVSAGNVLCRRRRARTH